MHGSLGRRTYRQFTTTSQFLPLHGRCTPRCDPPCLKRGARVNYPVHPCGALPLNMAISSSAEKEVAKALIKLNPKCVNFESEKSVSPLFSAMIQRDIPFLQYLLTQGANPFAPGKAGRPSVFDFIAGNDDPPYHQREILNILQDVRRNKPFMFQTKLKLSAIRG